MKWAATLAALVFAAPAGAATVAVATDAARYAPGAPVTFTVRVGGHAPAGATLTLTATHLGARVARLRSAIGRTLTWTPPAADHRGYLVQVALASRSGERLGAGWTAVDVSSDAATFPRYGFVSSYDGSVDPQAVARSLNGYHLDDVQFYDWEHASHLPLAAGAAWKDIAGRSNQRQVVLDLLAAVHATGADAYEYNTLYNAWADYAHDGSGVDPRWGLYRSTGCSDQVSMPLPSSWSTGAIDVFDPADPGWRSYLIGREREVFAAFPFDGWQVDQLGDQGTTYTCAGAAVDPADAFAAFLDAAAAGIGKKLVFNAVGQYGQRQVAADPRLSFLYTEAWPSSGQITYDDLARVIAQNGAWSGGTKKTVLAAYVDAQWCNASGGMFNDAGVLLADAAIFAHGGDHIELGDVDHMLCAPYFPNANLAMSPALTRAMHRYYDFLVAYENLLRDGQRPVAAKIGIAGTPRSTDGRVRTVWAFAESSGGARVLHFVNLLRAVDDSWQDAEGIQPRPPLRRNLRVTYCGMSAAPGTVTFASPDVNGGAAVRLRFTRGPGGCVRFALPELRYWDMVWVSPRSAP